MADTKIKSVQIITEDGFPIHYQSFGEPDDPDMLNASFDISALKSLSKEAMAETLSSAGLGDDDLILVETSRVIAIVQVILGKEYGEREELAIRRILLKCAQAIEEKYDQELLEPFFHKDTFAGIELLVHKYLHQYLGEEN